MTPIERAIMVECVKELWASETKEPDDPIDDDD
jgi:hypothetical protein